MIADIREYFRLWWADVRIAFMLYRTRRKANKETIRDGGE